MKTFRALFNDDMARAIVEGRKTVTRRPVVCVGWNPAGPEYTGESMIRTNSDPRIGTQAYFRTHEAEWHGVRLPCLPGDLLIGRECWCELDRHHYAHQGRPRDKFIGAGANGAAYRASTSADGDEIRRGYGYKWRSSTQMPDWAARIRRRVVSVTVERVQDITEEDAAREGIRRWTKDGSVYKFGHVDPGDIGCTPWADMARTGREAFDRLWNSIYEAKGLGWDANPWCWRIEFSAENVQEASDGR